MARRRRTRPEVTHYDDPLGLSDEGLDQSLGWVDHIPVAIPTGLSDEDDAQRLLHLKFAPLLGFCQNCEGTFECEISVDRTPCPACCGRGLYIWLSIPGTPPYGPRRKR